MAGQGKVNKQGDMTIFILIPVAIGGVVWLLWHRERPLCISVLYGLMYWEYALLHFLHILGPHGQQMYQYLVACLERHIDTHTVSWGEVKATEMDIGNRMRLPMSVISIALALVVYNKMAGDGMMRRFNMSGYGQSKILHWGLPSFLDKTHKLSLRLPAPLGALLGRLFGFFNIGRLHLGDMMMAILGFHEKKLWIRKGVSFMEFQAQVWAVTLSGAKFDPNQENKNRAQSRIPPEWMRDNNVLMTPEGKLNTATAEEAFAKQLGKPWTGIDNASLHVKALMVSSMLILMKGGTDKGVVSFRDKVAIAFTTKNYKAVRELVAGKLKGRLKEKITEVASHHAYTHTALLGVMGYCGAFPDWGGGDGSINAPAYYNWLKGIDRLCFYVIQQHGRKKFFVESAGAVSHFQVEYVTRNPVSDPYMESAIIGLEDYLEHHSISDLAEYFKRQESRRK